MKLRDSPEVNQRDKKIIKKLLDNGLGSSGCGFFAPAYSDLLERAGWKFTGVTVTHSNSGTLLGGTGRHTAVTGADPKKKLKEMGVKLMIPCYRHSQGRGDSGYYGFAYTTDDDFFDELEEKSGGSDGGWLEVIRHLQKR